MKIIFRVIVILVVATIIGGAIFAAVNSSGSSAGPQRVFEDNGDRPALANEGFHPNGEDRPETDGNFGGGIGLPFGMIEGLAIISIVAVTYFNASRFFGKKKTHRKCKLITRA